jgi:hypothetical protein
MLRRRVCDICKGGWLENDLFSGAEFKVMGVNKIYN